MSGGVNDEGRGRAERKVDLDLRGMFPVFSAMETNITRVTTEFIKFWGAGVTSRTMRRRLV